MSLSLNKNTLAYQFGVRPATQFRDMSGASTLSVAAGMNKLFASKGVPSYLGLDQHTESGFDIKPEADALEFYMMNHAVSLVRQSKSPYEPIGKVMSLVDNYHQTVAKISCRMFYYLLLICARESRHERSSMNGSLWAVFKQKYPETIIDFHIAIHGCSGSLQAAEYLKHKATPTCDIGVFTSYLYDNFSQGDFSGGFGGKAWAAVASVLDDFVHGKITAEMMLDTAFTLAHNNGPIFNKGMLYSSYSNEIYKILDVQRSGQIPQYVKTSKFSTGRIEALHTLGSTFYPEVFTGDVDWFQVEALGSLKKYPEEKKAQVAKSGAPVVQAKKKPAPTLNVSPKMGDSEDWIFIMPNLKIKKVPR